MPEVTIKFNLPDEQSEFETATNAAKYVSVIWEYSQYLRQCVKYADIKDIKQIRADDYIPDDIVERFQARLDDSDDIIEHVLQRARQKLFELINEEGLGEEF